MILPIGVVKVKIKANQLHNKILEVQYVRTIIKGIGGFYYVKVEDQVIECKARGKFRYNELTPLVGDKVEITVKTIKGL